MNLLGGQEMSKTKKENREISREDQKREEEEVQAEDIPEDKIKKVVRKMKLKKAVGIDGILMEAWKYGGEAVKKGLLEVIKRKSGAKERRILTEVKKFIININKCNIFLNISWFYSLCVF